MSPEAKVKLEARARLANNNWGKAIAIFFITISIPVLLSICLEFARFLLNVQVTAGSLYKGGNLRDAITYFVGQLRTSRLFEYLIVALSLSVLMSLVTLPLHLGVVRWNYLAAKGESPDVGGVFYYFSSVRLYFRSIWFSVLMGLRLLLWAVLLFGPGLSLLVFSTEFIMSNSQDYLTAATAGILGGSLLLLAGTVLFVLILLRYFLAQYVVVAKNEKSVNHCIHYSWRRMKGFRKSVFVLVLSFIGWFLLSFFVLPIIFVVPYFRVSLATCAKWIMQDKNEPSSLPKTYKFDN